jgi:hypothetical protein
MTQAATIREQPTVGWRFWVGVIFFALGFICPLFIPLVTASDISTSWKAILSGVLMLGIPELLWIIAVAFMGKEGFNYIKTRIFGFLKQYAPPDRVSKTRYRIGLVMFIVPLFFGWLGPYFTYKISGYETYRFIVNLAGDVVFLLSFFVLGGDFWDKIRALFMHGAKAQLPEQH